MWHSIGSPVLVMPNKNKDCDFDACVDALTRSYQEGKVLDNLGVTALPNRRNCIELLRALEPVLCLGFYARRPIEAADLRKDIESHLREVEIPLVDQVERALSYEGFQSIPSVAKAGTGDKIVQRVFAALPRIRRLLSADVTAAYEGDPAAGSVEEVVFSYPSITALTAYRVAHELHLAGVPLIPRILTEHAHSETGIDIHPAATIGESCFIDHGTGVVVGETAVIGNHVKLYQGVTLGALSIPGRTDTRKRHPTLEDHVRVYAGATILGGSTTIGARSVIGGNVWLTRSVPPDSKVFGGPREAEEKIVTDG